MVRADIVPQTWNEERNSVRVRWTAGADVLRYDWEAGRRYWERLDFGPDAIDVSHLNSGRCVVLDNHNRWSVRDAIGRVAEGSVAIDAQARTAEADVLFTRASDAQPVIERVKDGTVTGISFGYERLRIEKTEEMREGYPIYYVRRWRVKEISSTPMPADEAASTRSQDHGQEGLPENHNDGGEEPQRTQNMPPEIADTTKDEQARAAELKAAEKRAQEQERARQSAVRKLCKRHGMANDFTERLIEGGVSEEDASRQILEEIVKRDEATDTRSAHSAGFASVGQTDDEKFGRCVADGLLMRGGRYRDTTPVEVSAQSTRESAWLRSTRPLDGANEFAGLRLAQIAAMCVRRRGVNTDGMSEMRLWDALVNQRSIAPAHSSADFTSILSAVSGKALRMGYVESPRTFLPLARRVTVNDFKPRQVHTLSTAPDLEKIGANGEIKYGTLGESAQTYRISTYAKALGLTREAFINDDTGAFERLAQMFGASAARLESDIVWGLRTAEQVIDATGQILYHGTHNNTGTGALSVANLSAGYAKMATQRAPTLPDGTLGAILNIMPRFLVVPAALYATAVQFTASLTPNTQAAINPFAQGGQMPLIPIAEPRLDAHSTAEWYLDAEPGAYDTQEIAYLAGQEGVYLEQRIGFERDGFEWRARHDFGASWIDFRGTYRSTGA